MVVVGVFPHSVARISSSTDPADLFATWRRRYPVFIPVSGFRSDVDALEALIGFSLPALVPLSEAAELFHRFPVDRSVRRLIYSSIRQLGPLIAGPLLSEWSAAVRTAETIRGQTTGDG